MMSTSRSLTGLATLGLALAALAPPAVAANRAFSVRTIELDNPAQASCFAHPAGDPTFKNVCASTTPSVFLPMSVDNAGWYAVSIYGRGWIAPGGARNTIACIANTIPYNAGTLYGSGWYALPNNASFGGAQTLTLPSVPVYGPGDAMYAYCQLNPNTTIFTFGWN